MRFERPYIYHSEEVSACGCQNFSPEFLFRMLQGKKKHLKQPLVSAGTRYNRCLLKKRCYLQPLFFSKKRAKFQRSYGNITNHHWVEKNFSCCKLIEKKVKKPFPKILSRLGVPSQNAGGGGGGGTMCPPPPGWDRVKVARNEVKNASFAQRSAHRDSRRWRPELIEPAAERKRRARGRRPTFKSAFPDPQILPQCNISSNYPL